jgi:SAM-dependent methyltransferase
VSGIDFTTHRFTAPEGRRRDFLNALQDILPPSGPSRALDIGCGAGDQLLDMAQAFPNAECVGVDISNQNVEAAIAAAAALGLTRTHFHAIDYLALEAGTFDLAFADSVLQNIPVTTDDLVAKIARDLDPGGLLVATIPYDCLYNRVLWSVRRALRPLRGPAFESLVIKIARLLHPSLSREMIVERIPYLFSLPDRIDGPALRAAFAAVGLELAETRPVAHASFGQPKHRLLVLRRAV